MKIIKFVILTLLCVTSISYGMSELSGGPALIDNVEKGNIDVVKKLLVNGVNINFQDAQGETALMYAAENGQFDMVKLLLNYGALIFVKDIKGHSVIDNVDNIIRELSNRRVRNHALRNMGYNYLEPDLSNIIIDYLGTEIDALDKYNDILFLLENTAKKRAEKRKEKVKAILHARDFGVPVKDLGNLIIGYIGQEEEVANSGENYSQVESKEDEEEFYV